MFTTVIGRNSTLGKAVEQADCISTPAFRGGSGERILACDGRARQAARLMMDPLPRLTSSS